MKKSFWKYLSNDKETRDELYEYLESLERKLKDFEKAWLAFLYSLLAFLLLIITVVLSIVIFIGIFNLA